jgi:hypothetical protein
MELNNKRFKRSYLWFECWRSYSKNKLFYFFNVEVADRNESVLNAPGSVTSNISQETVQLISDKLKSKYNYDPEFHLALQLSEKHQTLFCV